MAQESCFKPTQAGCVGNSVSGALGNVHTQSPVLSIHQPITTLMLYKQNLFLCVAEVTGLFLDSHSVNNILISILPEKICYRQDGNPLTLRVMCSRATCIMHKSNALEMSRREKGKLLEVYA